MISRVNEGTKFSDAMNRIWKAGFLGVDVNRMMDERIVEPTVLYRAEKWGLNAKEKED